MITHRSPLALIVTVVAGLLLTLTACARTETAATTSECRDSEWSGHVGGTSTVRIFTPLRGAEAAELSKAMVPFERCTGTTATLISSDNFEAEIAQGLTHDADVLIVPQPSLVRQLAKGKRVTPLSASARAAAISDYGEEWLAYTDLDARSYATPLDVNVKSLVWYSPAMFARHGWSIPNTWDQLMTLSSRIRASGIRPWCLGIESGAATGWPVTDWIEDVVLRDAGAGTYDSWVNGDTRFASGPIRGAFDTVAAILKRPDWLAGTAAQAIHTPFQDSGKPILQGTCAMTKQQSSFAVQWPGGTRVGPKGDVDAFYLPARSMESPRPVLVAGHFVTGTNDEPATLALRRYLASSTFATARARQGGWITPHRGLSDRSVPGAVDRTSLALLHDQRSMVRYDGSDLMPAAVGAGAFWTESTAWLGGQSTATTLADIDRAWSTTTKGRSPP